jgi:predicted 3-demethylubiquinone-9 3-methyltransferase (glyoxalase superfamily)
MKSKVHPFLLFQGKAEEAMNLRLVVPRERDDDIVPYSPDQAGLKGSIMNATFTVGGETLL